MSHPNVDDKAMFLNAPVAACAFFVVYSVLFGDAPTASGVAVLFKVCCLLGARCRGHPSVCILMFLLSLPPWPQALFFLL